MFKNKNMHLAIIPKNGLKIIARATVGLYEARGEFQLVIDHMEDAGVGQLKQAFDQLKTKLSNTGLFDTQHKQSPPKHPKRIGIISSPTGAALRDSIKVLSRRSPHTPLLIYPSLVQGESASKELISAINKANKDKQCDVLLLVRGGGSIEDLWAFNNEDLAHVIFNSEIPIITGIGHEIDFTIADFVSDQRAPTPSVAAELATTDQKEQQIKVGRLQQQLVLLVNNQYSQQKTKLKHLEKRLQQHSGFPLIQQYKQTIDHLEQQLSSQISHQLKHRQFQLQSVEQRLLSQSPIKITHEQCIKLESLSTRLQSNIQRTLSLAQNRLLHTTQLLDVISPLTTMKRGYCIARSSDGVINSIKQVVKGEKINILMKDGELSCSVIDKNNQQG